jgi:hypothetical protein
MPGTIPSGIAARHPWIFDLVGSSTNSAEATEKIAAALRSIQTKPVCISFTQKWFEFSNPVLMRSRLLYAHGGSRRRIRGTIPATIEARRAPLDKEQCRYASDDEHDTDGQGFLFAHAASHKSNVKVFAIRQRPPTTRCQLPPRK